MASSMIMKRIKGRTSSYLFEEFPHLKKYWGRHFWARGYFCATVGQMTDRRSDQTILGTSLCVRSKVKLGFSKPDDLMSSPEPIAGRTLLFVPRTVPGLCQ